MGLQDSVDNRTLPRFEVWLLLLGLALRWPLWTTFRFREDEALYGYWAWLIYSRVDVMLRTAPVDKPPLFPYLVAWLYEFFSPSEVAARIPGLVASSLSLPLLYAWARRLFDRQTARRALFLQAVMPLTVLMAPTAYMDALMVGFCLLAAWAATRRTPYAWLWAAGSGMALAAGITTKPLALLWLPLVWGVAALTGRLSLGWGLAWLAGFAYPLWRWWEWERLRGVTSTVTMGFVHYGGISLLPPARWGSRLFSWAEVAAASWGGTMVLATVLGLAIVGGVCAFAGRERLNLRQRRVTLWLWAWSVGVGILYMVITIASWDRYLLTAAPIWAVLTARGWRAVEQKGHTLLSRLFVVLLLWVGVQSGRAAYPVGGDHGAYDGIGAVSAYIMAELPRGGVVYHHWLGWHYGFYLFGAPYDYRWWPDAAWLARDAVREPVPKVLVFQGWRERERQTVLTALVRAHVPVKVVARIYGRDGGLRFWIYMLGQP